MRYWAALLTLLVLLVLAGGLRFLLVRATGIPPTHEALYRNATAVTLRYTVKYQAKTITITDPDEVQTLVSAFHVTRTLKGHSWPTPTNGGADFVLADGSVIQTRFHQPMLLERTQWGGLSLTSEFYERVCAVLSRAEGRPIDVLKNNK